MSADRDTHILLVDDDEAVRDSIRLLLESAGYNSIAEANNGADALGYILKAVPNLVVLDIRMPGIDGIQVLETVKSGRRTKKIAVIIITGHGDVPLAVRALKAGASDFLEKPFDDEILLASIHRALDIGEKRASKSTKTAEARRLIGSLTRAERDVLFQLVAGRSNKIIAYELNISPYLVERRREQIMDKMNARSLSDLIRIAMKR